MIFTVLLVISLILLALVIWPFKIAFFLAAVLAGALFPWQDRLAARLGGRRQLAAAVLTLGVVVAVLLPLSAITTVVVSEVTDGARFVARTLRTEGVEGLVNELPRPLRRTARRVLEVIPLDGETLQEAPGMGASGAASAAASALRATMRSLLQATLMLVALFFLLVDGRRFVAWLASIAPLRRGQLEELLGDFRRTSVTVMKSSLLTAFVQAAAALVGYFIARVPQPFFFALVTFFFALIPVIGAASVSVVLGVALLLGGHTVAGVFLLIYGVLVVGLVDNIVKPMLIKGGMELHGAVVFFALLGGIAMFGPIGLLAGPLIVAFFLALVRMYDRDYGKGAEQRVAPAPHAEAA